MESIPQKDPQVRFEETPESIKVGDILRYHKDGSEAYFINQVGFRVDSIPVGTKVRTQTYSMGLGIGINMPETEGEVIFKDGKTLFNRELGKGIEPIESKFFNGDYIEIISLP
jgi:hypothetical protein